MSNPSESDLDRLGRYLAAPERREDTLPLVAVQGLMAAVISSPSVILPSRWLPEVLGEDHVYDGMDEAREISGLLMALYNDVARQLNAGESFDFIALGDEDETEDSIAAWCEGYLRGVQLADPPWKASIDPDQLGEMLLPFVALSGGLNEMLEEHRMPPLDPDKEERMLADLRGSLEARVLNNRAYWMQRSQPQPVRRGRSKVGRNDPCPCGSGKKFKQCCGRT